MQGRFGGLIFDVGTVSEHSKWILRTSVVHMVALMIQHKIQIQKPFMQKHVILYIGIVILVFVGLLFKNDCFYRQQG